MVGSAGFEGMVVNNMKQEPNWMDGLQNRINTLTRRDLLKGAVATGVGFAACGFGEAFAGEPIRVDMEHTFNVKKYGAKGDGTADDSKAAQKAIDAALKAKGGLIFFPSGSYRITRPLVFGSSDKVDVVGDGKTSVLLHEMDEPLLLWKEGATCRDSSIRNLCFTSAVKDKSYNTPVIAFLGGATGSFFSHLKFDAGSAKMGSGIVVENVMDTTTLDHCLMWGVTGTGVQICRGSEVRIFGGRIIGANSPFDGLDDKSIGVHLVGNNGGVHIVTTDLIALNTGLKIGQPGNTSNREIFITHATFDSSVHGIWQIDNAYTSIAGCWAASSDDDQILIDESASNAILTVSGGTIFNGGAYGRPGKHNGIVVRGGSFMLTGVTVRSNKGTGILVDNDRVRDYTINGCRITKNGTGAVLNGDNFTCTGNIFIQNETNLVDKGGPNKQVANNVVGPNE